MRALPFVLCFFFRSSVCNMCFWTSSLITFWPVFNMSLFLTVTSINSCSMFFLIIASFLAYKYAHAACWWLLWFWVGKCFVTDGSYMLFTLALLCHLYCQCPRLLIIMQVMFACSAQLAILCIVGFYAVVMLLLCFSGATLSSCLHTYSTAVPHTGCTYQWAICQPTMPTMPRAAMPVPWTTMPVDVAVLLVKIHPLHDAQHQL